MTKSKIENTKVPSVLPEMIVFDLDYTVWPEWIDATYGPPYKYDANNNEISNRYGEVLGFFKHTAEIIAFIKSLGGVKIGIASRTSTPEWARQAISLLCIPELDNTPFIDNVDYIEMYPGSKLTHFQALSTKSGIPCHKMLFFDDESRNKEVTRLGVHFTLVNTKTGITPFQFQNALDAFAKNSNHVQSDIKDFFQ